MSGAMLEQATGLIILPPALATPPLPPFLAGAGPDITVPNGPTVSLPPGSYGKLKLEEQAKLALEAGQYSFDEIRAHRQADITVDVINGTIVVDVAKDVVFDKEVAMHINNGSPSDVLFRTKGGIVLKKQGDFEGTFLALSGETQAAYTWPAAVVRVMDVFQVTTTNAQGEIGSFEQWVGVDSSFVYRPIVDR